MLPTVQSDGRREWGGVLCQSYIPDQPYQIVDILEISVPVPATAGWAK